MIEKGGGRGSGRSMMMMIVANFYLNLQSSLLNTFLEARGFDMQSIYSGKPHMNKDLCGSHKKCLIPSASFFWGGSGTKHQT